MADKVPLSERRAGIQAKLRRRRIAAVLLVPMILYGLMVVLGMLFEEAFIFFPTRYPGGEWEPAGLDWENAEFEAADGTRLHGWYVECEDPTAVILFSHGNAGNLTHRAETLHMLHRRARASVLIYDYRGYGKSEGRPDEKGVLSDARAARAWLAERTSLDPAQIVLMGRSLGGAVAVDLAARDGARALVLESTFSSIPDMAAVHYPWLPFRRLIRNRFDSLAKIGDYRGPMLQSHGDADRIVPYHIGRRLFDAAQEPKRWITLEGADHNDPQPATYYDQLREFLEGLPRQ